MKINFDLKFKDLESNGFDDVRLQVKDDDYDSIFTEMKFEYGDIELSFTVDNKTIQSIVDILVLRLKSNDN